MSVVRSVRATQVLRVYRFIDAICQAEADLQLHPRHGLKAAQDFLFGDAAFGKDLIEMRPVCARADVPQLYSIPEAFVIKGCEPFFYVLNVFKNNHIRSVSDHALTTQIWEVKP